jgi:hypothetical protein
MSFDDLNISSIEHVRIEYLIEESNFQIFDTKMAIKKIWLIELQKHTNFTMKKQKALQILCD